MSKPTLTPQTKQAGFTLIEVMVTVIVIGIIAAIATPNISLQLANQRIKSTTATLESVLKEARSESVIHRMPIMVDFDNDEKSKHINIQVPYSGPPLYFSSNVTFDWTGLFINTAMAGAFRPSKKPGEDNNQNDNNSSDQNNQGNKEDSSQDGDKNENKDDNQSGGDNQTENGKDPVGGEAGNTDQDGSTDDTEGSENNNGGSENNDDLDIEWVIAKNYTLSDKSIIKSNPDTIIFEPSKQANHSITYTICDMNKSAKPRQVTVSKLGIITSKLGGSC